jgi:hypothetical protein
MGTEKIIEVATRTKFLQLFNRTSVNLVENWKDTPDCMLKIVARQIVLEDGTVIQLKVK